MSTLEAVGSMTTFAMRFTSTGARPLLRAATSGIGALAIFASMAVNAFAVPMDHRPANFFALTSEQNKSVCAVALRSLNERHDVPEHLLRALNPNVVTDLFLTSDLQVQWRRIPRAPGGPNWQLDYASVDVANDGRPIPLFRWSLYDKLGHHSVLILPPNLPDKFNAAEPWTDDLLTMLLGQDGKNAINITKKSANFWSNYNFPANGTFDFNILRVGDKFYLLGAASWDADQTATQGGGFDAFLMEYHSMQKVSVICHFRAGDKAK